MRDQAGTDDLADESGQVGSNDGHLGDEVGVERLAVVGKRDNALGEGHHVLHVGFGDVLAHTVLRGLDDALGNTLVIVNDSSEIVQVLVRQAGLVLDEEGELAVLAVVGHNLDKLREVPAVPFADTHGEGVDRLVELVDDGDSLDDVVVVLLDGELDLSTRVGVTKTELRRRNIAFTETLEELSSVETETTEHVRDNLAGVAGFALEAGVGSLDAGGQVLVQQTEDDLALLAGLGEVQVEERDEELGGDTFGDIVDFAECLLVVSATELAIEILRRLCVRRTALEDEDFVLIRQKADEIDHLAELGELAHTILDFLQAISHSVGLVHDLEERVAHRALVEEVVSGHGGDGSRMIQFPPRNIHW